MKRRGDVRRAKLYYLRDLSGKAARIRENYQLVKRKLIASKNAPLAHFFVLKAYNP